MKPFRSTSDAAHFTDDELARMETMYVVSLYDIS